MYTAYTYIYSLKFRQTINKIVVSPQPQGLQNIVIKKRLKIKKEKKKHFMTPQSLKRTEISSGNEKRLECSLRWHQEQSSQTERSLFGFSRREREFLSRVSNFFSSASTRERKFVHAISVFDKRTRIKIRTIFKNKIVYLCLDRYFLQIFI